MMTRNQRGQAATEFIIAATFILLPLFLTVPLLGKYIDLRQSLIQQARFEAWEYTVWGKPTDQHHIVRSPFATGDKPWTDTRAEGNSIFLADPHTVKAYAYPAKTPQVNPLWIDHHGKSLLIDPFPTKKIDNENSPDPTGGVINGIFSIFKLATSFFGNALHDIGVDAKFDKTNTKGFNSSKLYVQVRPINDVLPPLELSVSGSPQVSSQPLTIHAQAAVLSDFWDSGSTEEVIEESKGLVFTALLSSLTKPLNNIINTLQTGVNDVSHLAGASVYLPHLPDFGHMEDGLIPFEHLEHSSRDGMKTTPLPTTQYNQGVYYYKDK